MATKFLLLGDIPEEIVQDLKTTLQEECEKNSIGPIESLFHFVSLAEDIINARSVENLCGDELDDDDHVWIANQNSINVDNEISVYCRDWISRGRKGMNPQTGEVFNEPRCDGVKKIDIKLVPLEENCNVHGISSTLF